MQGTTHLTNTGLKYPPLWIAPPRPVQQKQYPPGASPHLCLRLWRQLQMEEMLRKEKPQALNPLEAPRRSTHGHSQQGRDLVPPPPGRADMGISAGVSQADQQSSSW